MPSALDNTAWLRDRLGGNVYDTEVEVAVMAELQGRRWKWGTAFEEEAAKLRAAPGVPDIIAVLPAEEAAKARDIGAGVRSGRYRAFRPAGAFDCETHKEVSHDTEGQPVQVVNVYACYIGTPG